MGIRIVQGNIALAPTKAIVNAANSGLYEGAGVCGAIFGAVQKVGGHAHLTKACRTIGHCDEGSAVITPSFGLPSEFIIHAVGPTWSPQQVLPPKLNENHITSTRAFISTYTSISQDCKENNINSVSIPAISTGIFGFPKEFGAAIALRVCERDAGPIDVHLMAFSDHDIAFYTDTPSAIVQSHLKDFDL